MPKTPPQLAPGALPEPLRIETYRAAAGGWAALGAVSKSLLRHGAWQGGKTLLRANQPDGFDCPGCAWPDPKHASSFEFCENGAKAVTHEATLARATPELISSRTVSEWAQASDMELEALGRLTEPLRYDAASDRYLRTDWDQALGHIASVLRELPSAEAAFYTSGRTSNEAAFLYQLFVRALGSNNLPDCSNMCHEPSGVALKGVIGVGKGTVTLEDFDAASALFIFGQNPGSNHPRMLSTLRQAAQRGVPIVVFNPLRERGLERFADPKDARAMLGGTGQALATHYFQLRIGGDLALVMGIAKRLLELDAEATASAQPSLLDEDFITQHCSGFEAWRTHLQSLSWPQLHAAAGLSAADFDCVARLYAASPASIACWGMGITQHRRAVDTITQITALWLLKGNIGRPGAGLCPVRGHSNVQGDRTMGIDERPSAEFLARMQSATGIPMPPSPGLNTVETIAAMEAGTVRAFVALGGNFAAAAPDSVRTQAALARCALTVQISTKPNRSHFVPGREAYILPTLGRTERDLTGGITQAVTVEDSMSMVHASQGFNAPASPALRSEVDILASLAARTLPAGPLDWLGLRDDYERIRELIAAAIPGFENFNQRVRVPLGFYLRNSAREREWRTASGKAEFRLASLDAPAALAPFLLMTIRSHDQYNTTVYSLDDRYRGIQGSRQVLFIHPADLAALGLAAGDKVVIESEYGDGVARRVTGFACVPYDIPRQCLAAYFPETNPLIALESVAQDAGTPASKAVPVRLIPCP